MIGKIISHEWMVLVRDRALLIALPVYLAMLIYAVFSATAWKNTLEDRTTAAVELASTNIAARADTVERMLSGEQPYQIAGDARVAGAFARHMGFEMAAKPPAPSAAIAVGQSDVSPSYLRVQWKPMFKQMNMDEIASPRMLEIGTFDLSFVIIYLYPLLIIAFSYNLLSSEREGGTQALLLSQPVSLSTFVIAKVLLRGGLIIGIGTLTTAAALLVGNPDMLGGEDLGRIVLFMAIVAAYGAFWFGLAILVNALGARSATNALALMATWIGLVIVIPAGLNLAAKSLYPLPSRIQMVQSLREGDAAARAQATGQGRIFNADLLRKGEEEALEAGTIEFLRRSMPLEQRGEELAAPIFQEFEARKAAQQQFTLRLKYLSPATIAQAALNDLAENGAETFAGFNRQVATYQQQWRDYFRPFVFDTGYMTLEQLRAVPRFSYHREPNADIVGRALRECGGVLIWFALMLTAGLALLRVYPRDSR